MKDLIAETLQSFEAFARDLETRAGRVKTDAELQRVLDAVSTLAEAVTEIKRVLPSVPEKILTLEDELLVVLKDLLLALESPDAGAAIEALMPGLQGNLARWRTEGVIAFRRAIEGLRIAEPVSK